MPLYTYLDGNKARTMDVLRDFKDYEIPPTAEEAAKEGWTAEEFAAAEWERLLGVGVRTIRGDGWRGSKGNW